MDVKVVQMTTTVTFSQEIILQIDLSCLLFQYAALHFDYPKQSR